MFFIFFFKQKTAYEMRISDWSSDVCSSDLLGTIRVPRMVGAYDAGRIINPKIARSQCIGGMVQGLGMALMEQAEWDPRFGKVMNANLAEYLVPVCENVQQLNVTFVPGSDSNFTPLGAKGLAENAITRKSVVQGKRVLGRVDHGGPRSIK